jgi:hypothetical protein
VILERHDAVGATCISRSGSDLHLSEVEQTTVTVEAVVYGTASKWPSANAMMPCPPPAGNDVPISPLFLAFPGAAARPERCLCGADLHIYERFGPYPISEIATGSRGSGQRCDQWMRMGARNWRQAGKSSLSCDMSRAGISQDLCIGWLMIIARAQRSGFGIGSGYQISG